MIVDRISFDFVKGATVDYVQELIRSAFQVSLISPRKVAYELLLFSFVVPLGCSGLKQNLNMC